VFKHEGEYIHKSCLMTQLQQVVVKYQRAITSAPEMSVVINHEIVNSTICGEREFLVSHVQKKKRDVPIGMTSVKTSELSLCNSRT
jgi:hypothetical protein